MNDRKNVVGSRNGIVEAMPLRKYLVFPKNRRKDSKTELYWGVQREVRVRPNLQTGTRPFWLLQAASSALSRVRLFATPRTAARHMLPCPSPAPRSLIKPMSIELVMPSNYLILYHSLILLPSIFPSIRVFSNESVLRIRVAEVLKFQLQHRLWDAF